MGMTPAEQLEARRIGQRLAWARELVCGSRRQLARDTGIDEAVLRRIEAGVRMPTVPIVQALCHVLRVSPAYLLEGSLQGVEWELAMRLSAAHPELRKPLGWPGRGNPGNYQPNNGDPPRIPAPQLG